MFKPLGLLTQVAICPAHLQKHGSCDEARSQCPFGHPANPREQQQEQQQAASSTAASASKIAVESSTPEPSRGTQPLLKKRKVNAYDATKSSTATTQRTSTPQAATPSTSTPSASASSSSARPTPTVSAPFQRPPVIAATTHSRKSTILLSSRNTYLKTLWTEYTNVYSPLIRAGDDLPLLQEAGRKLAFQDALAQEADIFSKATKLSYKTTVVTTITGIRKRNRDEIERVTDDLIDDYHDGTTTVEELEEHLRKTCTEVGTASQVDAKRRALEQRAKSRLTGDRLRTMQFVTPPDVLLKSGYDGVSLDENSELEPVDADKLPFSPSTEVIDKVWGPGSSQLDFAGEKKICARCQAIFKVEPASVASQEACIYHWGKKRFIRDTQSRSRIQQWTCCQRNVDGSQLGGGPSLSELAGFGGPTQKIQGDSAGCCAGPHVFKEESVEVLHKMEGFVSTAQLKETSEEHQQQHEILALDCEMAYTTAGMDVIRVTILSEDGEMVLDQLIKPRADILDTNVQFSGVTASQLSSPDLPTLSTLRKSHLSTLVGPSTILIGHGLENDLRALRLLHPTVIDTALLFPHPRGPPLRQGLKALSERYLQRSIQLGSGTDVGHSSAEDAKAALDLVKYAALRQVHVPWVGAAGGGAGGQQKMNTLSTAAAGAGASATIGAEQKKTTGNLLIASGKKGGTATSTNNASVLISRGGGKTTGTAPPQQSRLAPHSRSQSGPSGSSSANNPLFIPKKRPRS